MLKITMDTPGRDEELELARRTMGDDSPEAVLERGEVRAAIGPEDLVKLRALLREITIRDELVGYIVEIVRKTRVDDSVMVGAGPRATQALILGSRIRAVMASRDFVTPDDVKSISLSVLEHRLALRPEYEIEGLAVAEVIERILKEVAVPR